MTLLLCATAIANGINSGFRPQEPADPRHAVACIMDTFPIVKRKDETAHGAYRTRDTVLEI
jgi:hypothetical protein